MNKVFLVGRLTRDFDVRYGANNTAVARNAIAVDRQPDQNGERTADFINIVAFGNRAETMKKYLNKGSQIAISGRIQTGSYDDKDGKKVYTTDVIVDEFQFLDSKASRNLEPQTSASVYQPANPVKDVTPYDFSNDESSTVTSDPFKDFGDKIEINDSDLPF